VVRYSPGILSLSRGNKKDRRSGRYKPFKIGHSAYPTPGIGVNRIDPPFDAMTHVVPPPGKTSGAVSVTVMLFVPASPLKSAMRHDPDFESDGDTVTADADPTVLLKAIIPSVAAIVAAPAVMTC
jgi:hypothetical protein